MGIIRTAGSEVGFASRERIGDGTQFRSTARDVVPAGTAEHEPLLLLNAALNFPAIENEKHVHRRMANQGEHIAGLGSPMGIKVLTRDFQLRLSDRRIQGKSLSDFGTAFRWRERQLI